MQYSLHVTCAPYSQQGNLTALNFATALIKSGHTLNRVFFSSDGVLTGSNLTVIPQDEIDIPAQWQALATDHQVELILCVSACLKRGIIDQGEASRYETSAHNMAPSFTLSGLGQLAEAAITSDRLVTFGA